MANPTKTLRLDPQMRRDGVTVLIPPTSDL